MRNPPRGLSPLWLLAGAVVLVAAAVAVGSGVDSHCADYPTGHRCTDSGKALILLSCTLAAAGVVAAGAAAVRAVRRVRG
jgi:hypothetical protein